MKTVYNFSSWDHAYGDCADGMKSSVLRWQAPLDFLGGPSIITGPYKAQRDKEGESGVRAGCQADCPEDRGWGRGQGVRVPWMLGKAKTKIPPWSF